MHNLNGDRRSTREVEILDSGDADASLVARSLDDIVVANTRLGGTRAVLTAVAPLLDQLPANATLLDAGTGAGDIPARVRDTARRRGIALQTIGLDALEVAVRKAQAHTQAAVCGNVLALPFADHSIDLVICSQVLHHFGALQAPFVLQELDRVARVGVVVSDLHRSLFAQLGLWASSFLFRFHPVSRHDGLISIRRGFTPKELRAYVQYATGQDPVVRRRLGFRITATWTPRVTPPPPESAYAHR